MRPKLIIIAGPNGSGKTTFTPQMLQHDWADDCLFINPDEIAKNEFGDWTSPEAVMKAVVRAQEMREGCLNTGQSMLIESVFSAPDKLDFIRRAKDASFFIHVSNEAAQKGGFSLFELLQITTSSQNH